MIPCFPSTRRFRLCAAPSPAEHGALSVEHPLGRQSDDGAGADAGLALQLQASARQLHEAIGQRQAEPGALELAAETAVDLLEGREGTRDVLGGDADAGVAHLEKDRKSVV